VWRRRAERIDADQWSSRGSVGGREEAPGPDTTHDTLDVSAAATLGEGRGGARPVLVGFEDDAGFWGLAAAKDEESLGPARDLRWADWSGVDLSCYDESVAPAPAPASAGAAWAAAPSGWQGSADLSAVGTRFTAGPVLFLHLYT
jgi:hypothetical protein